MGGAVHSPYFSLGHRTLAFLHTRQIDRSSGVPKTAGGASDANRPDYAAQKFTQNEPPAGVGTKLTIQTDCCGYSHADIGFTAVVLLASCCCDDRQNSTRGFSQKSIFGDIDSSGSGMR